MKKIILLILANLTFLTAEDVKIKSAGTGANDGVVFKNSIDSTLVDIDGTGVMNIKGIPTAGATLRLFEAFGNGSNYLQLNPGVSLAENATWNLSSAGGSGNMFLGFESGSAVTSDGLANVGLGYNAAKVLTSGIRNVALGYKALTAGTEASNNVAIGYQAGDVLTTGQKNIIIGSGADPSAATGQNQVVIGFEAVGTADNQVVLGNSTTTQWIPGAADATDLGSTSAEFNNLYLGDGAVVNLGVDQDVSLTHIADTGVQLNGASQLQFRDATLNVSSTADGQLDVDADAELELVAPIVDIDASTEVNISGELKVGGKISIGADADGADVVFYSATSGDEFTWDASEEKLIIDGGVGNDALTITEGNITVANNITATNITATSFIGNGSSLTGVPASTIGTLPGASPLELEGETADGYETTITVTDPTADRTITLPNADGTVSLTGVSETLSNKTLIGPIVAGSENSSGSLHIYADDGDDDNDKWRLETANGGNMTIDSKQSSSWSTLVTLGNTGALTVTGTVAANGFSGDGSALTGVPAASISTLPGASPLVLEGSTVNDYETTIAVTDPTADRTLTLPNATGTLATTTGTETFTNKTLTSPDINGGTVDGAAIGGSSASTGAFTTASASTAIQTPLIEYTDGDDAITIADGGVVTTSGALTVTGLVTGSSLDVDDVVVDGTTIGHTDDTDLMTLASGTLTVAGTVAATTLTGDGSGITGVAATSIGTLAGASPLVLEGATADAYETTITVTDPTADRTLTLPNATGTLATTTGTETFTNKTLTSPDINGGTVDGAAIGASSASTGAFTTASASTAIKTPLIEYTDGDDAITIADGGAITTAANAIVTGDLTVTGNDIAFGNGESISNGTDGTVAITGAATVSSTLTANANLAVKNGATSAGGVSFYEDSDNGGNYMKLQAGSMSADVTLTLPTADGSNGQVLSTNGSGTMSWASTGASSLGALTDALSENNSMWLGEDPSGTTNAANYNVSVGTDALDAITTGDNNVAMGYNALTANTTGNSNVAIGHAALKTNTIGRDNIAIGDSALLDLVTTSVYNGYRNVAVGSNAMEDATTAAENVAVGADALNSITSAWNNTAIGYKAMENATSGGSNVAMGGRALNGATSGTAMTGGNNTAIGYYSLFRNTTGYGNTALGAYTLYSNTQGYNNIALGYYGSLYSNTTGDNNIALGYYSLNANTTANANIGIGYYSLRYANRTTDTDGYNIGLGYQAGDVITTGQKNTIIGSKADPSANSASNQTVIGYGATGHGDNIVVIGNGSVTAWHPSDDNEVDLGSSSKEFKDLYVDGVANVDAVRTGLIEYNDGDDAITIADGGDMDFNGNAIEDFTASIPSEITSATTLAASHNGQVLICNSSSDFSLTIPEDTLPKGFNCLIVQKGAGEITLAAASGNVVIRNRNSHTKTANQWAIMTLICIDATTDANVFVSSGDGTS